IAVPNYDIVELLGEGHSAVVYKAYRQGDVARQPLTLKVFKEIYLSPGQQARLRRELHLLERLESPYLVEDVSLEEQGGLFVLVSRYDKLRSLQEWLGGRPCSVDQLLLIAIHLTQALADIH